MSDKKRESMASKIDEVAKNQIWREQLKTEYLMESALTSFQLNPKTLSSITQKPTRTHPADFAKVHEDEDTKALAAKMKEITKKPSEKYPMPLTEAQRIGYNGIRFCDSHGACPVLIICCSLFVPFLLDSWLHEMATKGIRADMHQRMFKGRGSCDVTTFADTYCTMAGCSPFADKSTR